MSRIAHCSCGSLRVETTGEPTLVAACHCRECQRRTGTPYGVSAYFSKSQVRAEGANKIYIRDGQDGRKMRFCFCPTCGTSVYWETDYLPGQIGVAVGTFADPLFPAPTLSVWQDLAIYGSSFGTISGNYYSSQQVTAPLADLRGRRSA